MKFICTVGYFLLAIAISFLVTKNQKLQLAEFQGGRAHDITVALLSYLVFFISFLQFWLLTRLFPIALIAILLGASVLATVINSLIGAVAGFTLPETREKIGALSLIWGMQEPIFGCSLMATSFFVLAIGVFGSLWEFWSHPIGSAHAKVWIAIFHFLLPQIFGVLASTVSSWRIVTSEFMDDDLRNSSLAKSFSAITYQTLALLFPLWLVRNEMQPVLGRSLPPYWVFLSIPLLVFMIGSLLPFFIGVYRYRSQSCAMLRWQELWLKEMNEIIRLPMGPARDAGLNEKLSELDNEISRRSLRMNSLRSLTLRWSSEILASPPQTLPAEDALIDNEDPETRALREKVRVAIRGLRGDVLVPAPDNDLEAQIQDVLAKHRHQLVEWDVRFGYLWRLLHLYEVGLEAKKKDISAFVEARLQDIKTTTGVLVPKSNVLVGTFMAALSSVMIFLFRAFQSQIIDFVGQFVRYRA